MKINWKVRFKNGAWLMGFFALLASFTYQVLGMFNIVVPVSQDQVVQFINLFINILIGVGIVVDPTTKGFKDSTRAMRYTEPN